MFDLCVGDREARADSQCGELIDRIAASAPVRKLLFVEALGHTRLPFAVHGSLALISQSNLIQSGPHPMTPSATS